MTNKVHTYTSQEIANAEHDTTYRVKNVAVFGYTGSTMAQIKVNDNGEIGTIDGLSVPAHDYIEMSYASSNMTGVVYKTGGSSGTPATIIPPYLTMNYIIKYQ